MGLPQARRGTAAIPPAPARWNVAEGHARWVRGGLGQSPAWEGGLGGPEGGGRRVWSGIWIAEPTRVIYAPSLRRELGGTAIQTTKGRFSRRPPAQPRLPKKQLGPGTAANMGRL